MQKEYLYIIVLDSVYSVEIFRLSSPIVAAQYSRRPSKIEGSACVEIGSAFVNSYSKMESSKLQLQSYVFQAKVLECFSYDEYQDETAS